MTNEQLITQLTGRVAALEYLLAQTMTLVILDRSDPQGTLSDMRAYFESAAANIERQMPEARPAAEEAGGRVYDVVQNRLQG